MTQSIATGRSRKSFASRLRCRKVVRVLGPACYVALGISASVGDVQGLVERILVCVCVTWPATLAVGLIANAGCES